MNPKEFADAAGSVIESGGKGARTAEKYPWGTTVMVTLGCLLLNIFVTWWIAKTVNGNAADWQQDAKTCRLELKEERSKTSDLTEKLLLSYGILNQTTQSMSAADSALNEVRPAVKAISQNPKK